MALTPKQEAFAQAIADGKTQADAYRLAFNVSPTIKPDTVYKRASELMANGEIKGRVASMRDALAEKAIWTREDSLRGLADIANGVDPEAKPSDRVNAIKALNAMQGYDSPQKLNVSGDVQIVRMTSEAIKQVMDKDDC